MRFLHTADWQLGMTRHFLSPDAQPRYSAARRAAITALGAVAEEHDAEFVVVAGDVFEHNRLKADVLDRSRDLLSDAPMPVVMLPGNHDPLTPDSVWIRGELGKIDHVFLIGLETDTVRFDRHDLEIWGRAHMDYGDLNPLEDVPERSAARQLVAAHGHFVEELPVSSGVRASWLFTPEDIDATAADYIALGHWNVATDVGTKDVPAHYSGSPDYAGTINLIKFGETASATVEAVPVQEPLG